MEHLWAFLEDSETTVLNLSWRTDCSLYAKLKQKVQQLAAHVSEWSCDEGVPAKHLIKINMQQCSVKVCCAWLLRDKDGFTDLRVVWICMGWAVCGHPLGVSCFFTGLFPPKLLQRKRPHLSILFITRLSMNSLLECWRLWLWCVHVHPACLGLFAVYSVPSFTEQGLFRKVESESSVPSCLLTRDWTPHITVGSAPLLGGRMSVCISKFMLAIKIIEENIEIERLTLLKEYSILDMLHLYCTVHYYILQYCTQERIQMHWFKPHL